MKRRIATGLVAAAALLMFAAQVANVRGQGNGGQSEVQRGFDIAPVPLNLDGKNRGLVGLGSYYVNGVSDCIGCHTTDGGGYLGGGEPFGPVLSRNLTPDQAGLPAGLTLDQFKDDIRSLGADDRTQVTGHKSQVTSIAPHRRSIVVELSDLSFVTCDL